MAVRRVVLGLGLILGLLGVAPADLRARDPGLEDEPRKAAGHSLERFLHGTRGGPQGHRVPASAPLGHAHLADPAHHQVEEVAPLLGDAASQNSVKRIGNWCSYISYRVVTMKVSYGTEKYTIKSQSPCPSGSPDCQLVMYKLSVRPVYKELPKIVSAQLWRCCPGHGGSNCEDTVTQGHVSDSSDQTGSAPPVLSEIRRRDERQAHPDGFQAYEHFEEENSTETALKPDQAHTDHFGHQHDYNHGHDGEHDSHHNHNHHFDQDYDNHKTDVDPSIQLPFPYGGEPLSLLHIETMLMARIQPFLDSFNQTLQHLSQEVGDLSQDLAEHRREWVSLKPAVTEPPEVYRNLEYRLDNVQREMEDMSVRLEDRLHSQHAMLHYNLTNFKTDMDGKIKRTQKMIQVSLQSLNASLADVREDHAQLEHWVQRGGDQGGSVKPSQQQEDSAMWEAINSLDKKVINHTVKVDTLLEDLNLARNNIGSLHAEYQRLDECIKDTSRKSQIQYMETGLDVEAAKVEVLRRVNELVSNLTEQENQLRDIDSDTDYLFIQFYKILNSTSCNCETLAEDLSRLSWKVVNVTELANENKLALETTDEQHQWYLNWDTSMDDVNVRLLQVQESLASEQNKSRLLAKDLSQLYSGFLGNQQDIHNLYKKHTEKEEEMNRLSSFFDTLLKDAIRHSEVLEILLGEEVLEFRERSSSELETYSIPVLQAKIKRMSEQIKSQNHTLHSVRMSIQSEDPDMYEHTAPTEWSTRGLKRRSGDQSKHAFPESRLLPIEIQNLAREIERLGVEVSRSKAQGCLSCCNCTDQMSSAGQVAQLDSEVALMRAALQDHLRLFKSVFSNTEMLAGSDDTLDLDQLWAMVKDKEEKRQGKSHKEKKKGSSRQSQNGGQHNKRDSDQHPDNKD
ncbi:multimerin-2a isoform X2 [Paramormyrops kingsleyae]|uniref:multimerin-2a isoform X2 n=1 Tax=Paramormyrops kingsleyae TaxID=1676925 RepID=UPI000CD61E9F|nr:multimerin-2 isoform X2 [Paramormyrops kingsleyae]